MSIGSMACSRQRRHVLGVVAHRENGAGDFRMHGFDAAIEHFREAGDFADIAHGNAGFAQQTRRAAGRNQFGAERGEPAANIGHTGLIGDADEYSHEESSG